MYFYVVTEPRTISPRNVGPSYIQTYSVYIRVGFIEAIVLSHVIVADYIVNLKWPHTQGLKSLTYQKHTIRHMLYIGIHNLEGDVAISV